MKSNAPIKMSFPEFKKEHIDLVRVDKSGNKKKIKQEGKEQAKELVKESRKRKQKLPKDIYKSV